MGILIFTLIEKPKSKKNILSSKATLLYLIRFKDFVANHHLI
nr:MAG TPA: hypothetical protein [Bacteriophage sp.]DAX08035.1 MAG TPA: hypothetical protein [Bacteriophage sp.]